jgi:chromosome segregation ATPase
VQEADKNKINQMQSVELDLKSQLETAQTAQAASQDEVKTLTADLSGLQQQLTDKQHTLDQLTSDKQSLETDTLQKLSAQQSELEQLTSDKQLSAQALTTKDTEIVSLATHDFLKLSAFSFCCEASRLSIASQHLSENVLPHRIRSRLRI